jgi:acetyl esterase/lipase
VIRDQKSVIRKSPHPAPLRGATLPRSLRSRGRDGASILTSGTRDLFLSNTVRVHRKMRAAGVAAELHVFEGQSHAQYAGDPVAPETKEHFKELARFFDKHLAR